MITFIIIDDYSLGNITHNLQIPTLSSRDSLTLSSAHDATDTPHALAILYFNTRSLVRCRLLVLTSETSLRLSTQTHRTKTLPANDQTRDAHARRVGKTDHARSLNFALLSSSHSIRTLRNPLRDIETRKMVVFQGMSHRVPSDGS